MNAKFKKKILSERIFHEVQSPYKRMDKGRLRDSKIFLTEFNPSIKTLSTALTGPELTKTSLLHLTVAENFLSPEPKFRGDKG